MKKVSKDHCRGLWISYEKILWNSCLMIKWNQVKCQVLFQNHPIDKVCFIINLEMSDLTFVKWRRIVIRVGSILFSLVIGTSVKFVNYVLITV